MTIVSVAFLIFLHNIIENYYLPPQQITTFIMKKKIKSAFFLCRFILSFLPVTFPGGENAQCQSSGEKRKQSSSSQHGMDSVRKTLSENRKARRRN